MIKVIATLAALSCLSTPALAIDNCIVGTWHADMDDLAHVMAMQMNGAVAHKSGEAIMGVTDTGGAAIVVENAVFRVQMEGAPEMDVTVDGYSSGIISTTDGAWALTTCDYDLTGSADVLGQIMTIPFTSEMGLFGGGLGIYGCTEHSLSFESTGDSPRMPRRWTR